MLPETRASIKPFEGDSFCVGSGIPLPPLRPCKAIREEAARMQRLHEGARKE